ncbi:hypothetical protein ACJX0J_033768, partial [Zea mays]
LGVKSKPGAFQNKIHGLGFTSRSLESYPKEHLVRYHELVHFVYFDNICCNITFAHSNLTILVSLYMDATKQGTPKRTIQIIIDIKAVLYPFKKTSNRFLESDCVYLRRMKNGNNNALTRSAFFGLGYMRALLHYMRFMFPCFPIKERGTDMCGDLLEHFFLMWGQHSQNFTSITSPLHQHVLAINDRVFQITIY